MRRYCLQPLRLWAAGTWSRGWLGLSNQWDLLWIQTHQGFTVPATIMPVFRKHTGPLAGCAAVAVDLCDTIVSVVFGTTVTERVYVAQEALQGVFLPPT